MQGNPRQGGRDGFPSPDIFPYFFGKLGQRWLGLMIRVMSCIITHDPGISAPEFSSSTIVIRSRSRFMSGEISLPMARSRAHTRYMAYPYYLPAERWMMKRDLQQLARCPLPEG